MARFASPQKTHRPKDLCTIEQADYIAREAVKEMFTTMYVMEKRAERALAKRNRWYRRLWRALRADA